MVPAMPCGIFERRGMHALALNCGQVREEGKEGGKSSCLSSRIMQSEGGKGRGSCLSSRIMQQNVHYVCVSVRSSMQACNAA